MHKVRIYHARDDIFAKSLCYDNTGERAVNDSTILGWWINNKYVHVADIAFPHAQPQENAELLQDLSLAEEAWAISQHGVRTKGPWWSHDRVSLPRPVGSE